MPVRLRIPRGLWSGPLVRVLLVLGLVLALIGGGIFAYAWFHFSRFIDSRLSGEIFERASHVYAAPELAVVGAAMSREDVVSQLRNYGYSGPDQPDSHFGRYRLTQRGIEIQPGPGSRVGAGEAVRLEWAGSKIARIQSLRDSRARESCWLDPPLVTNLFDRNRAKRRLVRYENLPPHLIQALLAAEDRRFFSHPGISFWDGLRALWVDIRKGAPVQGASTVTMQLARSFFLTPSRTLRRKASEAIIALQLERRFNKEKILELYANEVYLGHRGSFSIHGFGEGAQAYFDKDVSQLSLSEAALLAGTIRGPNRYNPYRSPERALERRNYILDAMVETEAISREEAEAAKREPLRTTPPEIESSEAPYFVDLVRDSLLGRFTEEDLVSSSYRINTTLDLHLQHAAFQAVQEAMPEVDAKIKERYRHRKEPPPQVQVAMVVLDPHTGAVKALIGGRDYAASQLNRAIAPRQPGSGFKPFVYAAAFAAALEDPEHAITPITTVVDEPTVFEFEGQRYEPSNYGEKFFGIVTVRDALIHSLNVATVKVAEMAGFDRVAAVAVASGLNPRLRPTPAISLGAYDSTPVEVAGAYTVFANDGQRVEPYLISTMLDPEGRVLLHQRVEPRSVLDPRVAYLVLDLMQDAMNRGTGAGARARGFTSPAAGKTGTSRDGWFIGFTSNLLAAVWVGFDDARDLGLPGSAAALPVWTSFMKRAVALPAYRNVEEFIPPDGIVAVPIDPETLAVAVPECPLVRTEKFLVGTEPHDLCPRHRPSGFRSVTRSLLRAIGLGRDARRVPEPQPANPPKPAAEKEPGEDEFEEVEIEVEQRRDPEGPGMLRRAATSIGAVPLKIIKRVKKKKKEVNPEPPRE
ncbi:MAG: transglycosylase domain-containing protein [Candidatus Acidiferrales bacterium]